MSIEPQESNDAMDIIGPYNVIPHIHIVLKYTYYRGTVRMLSFLRCIIILHLLGTVTKIPRGRYKPPLGKIGRGTKEYSVPISRTTYSTGPEGSNKDVHLPISDYKNVQCIGRQENRSDHKSPSPLVSRLHRHQKKKTKYKKQRFIVENNRRN